jgi:tetratricopeptide (TPR) repeat protein
LIRTGDARSAITYADRAVRLAPESADALAVLGYAQFAADRAKDAIQSWKRSLALRPDASIQQVMARAEREASAESTYSERETGHFVLRYEGAQSSAAFRSQLLSTLESDYEELSHEFGGEPRSSIQVILYTNQAFFDVTQSPSWVGAINDGKLRIPLQGLDSVTSGLARVLKHEVTHSFVNQLSMNRCPQWLNEGIAQMMEPRPLVRGAQLAELFRLQQEVPLNSLEGGFTSLSGTEAALAYDESLAAVQYIRDRYGMSDLLRILERLGHGESPEAALRSTIHCDYRQLQDEIRAELLRQFGR